MSSFLYRLGRLAAQRRRSVLVVWLVVLALACGGALFNEGTDDTFEIPGTQSQDALDHLARVFPETSGSSTQLVIVVTPGQDVTKLSAGPTANAVEAITRVDQVASVINPFDPNPANQTIVGEQPRMQGAVSEDHRAAILTAQLTVPLADVKQDTRDQLTDIGQDLATAIGHGATVYVGGPAFSNPVPKLSPTEGIGLLIALIVLLIVFGVTLLTALTFMALNQAVTAIFKRPGRFASIAVLVLALVTSLMSTIPAALHTIGGYLPTHAAILALRGINIGSGVAVTGVVQLAVWLVIGALATVLVTEQRRALSSKQLRLGSVPSPAT